jgi:hypothetical protein
MRGGRGIESVVCIPAAIATRVTLTYFDYLTQILYCTVCKIINRT